MRTETLTPQPTVATERPMVLELDRVPGEPPGPGKKARRGVRLVLGIAGLLVAYATLWLAAWAVVPALVPGWRSVVITSGSMSPSIRSGDVVVVAPSDGKGLSPGTVAVFSDPARPGFLTHRIESVNPDGSYVTRGDANLQPDSTPLRPEQVVGEGRLLVPYIGLPLMWYWMGAWAKLAFWAAGTLLALWLTRYVPSSKFEPPAQLEKPGHAPG